MDITTISLDILKCQSIKRLVLSDNEIVQIPNWLSQVESLEYIDLSNNQIQTLELDSLNFKNLKEINLTNNKFRNKLAILNDKILQLD